MGQTITATKVEPETPEVLSTLNRRVVRVFNVRELLQLSDDNKISYVHRNNSLIVKKVSSVPCHGPVEENKAQVKDIHDTPNKKRRNYGSRLKTLESFVLRTGELLSKDNDEDLKNKPLYPNQSDKTENISGIISPYSSVPSGPNTMDDRSTNHHFEFPYTPVTYNPPSSGPGVAENGPIPWGINKSFASSSPAHTGIPLPSSLSSSSLGGISSIELKKSAKQQHDEEFRQTLTKLSAINKSLRDEVYYNRDKMFDTLSTPSHLQSSNSLPPRGPSYLRLPVGGRE